VEGSDQGDEAAEDHEVSPNPKLQAEQIARQIGIPVSVFKSLISHESGWNPKARSPAGARGYGQLMPATARGLGVNPDDPYQNLLGSARYLKRQLTAFNGNVRMALAAYNAGPAAVKKYGGIPPYAETQAYVRNIMHDASVASGGAPLMKSIGPDIGAATPAGLDPGAALKRRELRAALTPGQGVTDILRKSVGQTVANSIMHEIPLPHIPKSALTGDVSSGPLDVGTPAGGPWKKWVKLSAGADRAGVATKTPVLEFVGSLGKQARRRLVIGTGTNHSHMTVDGNVSDHWTGDAADIPATGHELRRLGYLALVQAGMNAQEAARARKTGGLFNVGRYQIIFATHQGGDHYNHLHVGVRG
jgi:hypothetical protein